MCQVLLTISWAENIKTFVTEKIPEIIDSIVQFFSELPGRIWEWLTNVISNVITWAAEMQVKSSEAASNFFENIATKIQELPGHNICK